MKTGRLEKMVNRETKAKVAFIVVFLSSLVVSTCFKIYFISAKELHYNEIFSSFLINHSFPKMMHIIVNDIHPPLYYLLLKFWSLLFGISGESLRAFSVFSSVLLSLCFYWLLLKIIKNRLICLLGFLLIQFSPFLFDYSVLARMYMLATAFVILSFVFLLRITESQPVRYKDVALFSLSCALSYYTNYLSMIAVVSFFLFYFLRALYEKKSLKPVFASLVIVFAMTAPWYPTMWQQEIQHRKNYDDVVNAQKNHHMINYGYNAFPERPWGSYAVDMSSEPYHVTVKNRFIKIFGIPTGSRAIIRLVEYSLYVTILFFFMFSLWKKNYASCLTLVVTAAYITGNFILGITGDRYFIFLAPFIILLTALAMSEMLKFKFTTPLCVFVSCCVLVFYISGTVRKLNASNCKPITQVVKLVRDNYRSGDVVVFSVAFFEVPFDYYASLSGFHPVKTGFPISIQEWWERQPYKGWAGPVISKNDLDQFVKKLKNDNSFRSIWLVLDGSLYDPWDQLLQEMQRNFHRATKYDINFSECGNEQKKTLEQNYRVYKVERN